LSIIVEKRAIPTITGVCGRMSPVRTMLAKPIDRTIARKPLIRPATIVCKTCSARWPFFSGDGSAVSMPFPTRDLTCRFKDDMAVAVQPATGKLSPP
jgi:hypothetical protein